MITIQQHGNVSVIQLNRSITNAINLELVNELTGVLQKLKSDNTVKGIVLSSSNDKFFSIGWDIPTLFELNREDFAVFYQAFNQACLELCTLPKPTVAAITGHAIAGGCILALCCDYRIISDGRKLMGLNEIKLGVPIPYPADCILRQLVGLQYAREIMDIGEFYTPEESKSMGMVDQVLPLSDVLEKSIAKAELLGSMPQLAFEVIKQNRVEEIAEQVAKHKEKNTEQFLDCWFSDEARKRLKAAMEKF